MSFIPKEGERHWHCSACQKDYTTRYGLVMHKVRTHGLSKKRLRRCRKWSAS